VRTIVEVLSDLLKLGTLFLCSSSAIRAENLVLRRQLAQYIERGIKPQRVYQGTRVNLSVFSRLFNWRDAIVDRARVDHRSLAPTGLADPLAVQVQGGSAADSAGAAGLDSSDRHGECSPPLARNSLISR
jgi:hypothetical protein